MQHRTLTVILALLTAACSDRPSAPQAISGAESRLQSTVAEVDPGAYVQTPTGPLPRACVHEIPSGARVDRSGLVHRPDGGTNQLSRCLTPHQSNRRFPPNVAPPALAGYLEHTYDVAPTVVRTVAANWTVPAAPASSFSAGEVYYAFPGVLKTGETWILQPVLAYTTSGWTIASWRCNDGTDCDHSTPVSASAGHSLHGSIVATNCSAGTCDWTVTTQDVTASQQTGTTWTDDDAYIEPIGGAVEVHGPNGGGLPSCDKLPVTGVFFSSISVTTANGTMTPSWSEPKQSGSSPGCMLAVSSTASTTNLYHNPIVTLSGNLAGEVPTITWSAVPGATSYTIYREWYNYQTEAGSSGFESMGSGSSGWTDPNLCADLYTGGTTPNFSTHGYIKYQIVANGIGTASSQVVNFRLADCA
jgi:hypothetical protein